MRAITLDFDNEAKVNLSFFAGNYYEKVFHVTKGGVDYDWANVTEIILQVKSTTDSADKIIELKLSNADFVLTTGYMVMKLPTTKTDVEPGEYKSVELLIIFSSTKPRTWWSGGVCKARKRAIILG